MNEHRNETWQSGFDDGYLDFQHEEAPHFTYRSDPKVDNLVKGCPIVDQKGFVICGDRHYSVGYIAGYEQASIDTTGNY